MTRFTVHSLDFEYVQSSYQSEGKLTICDGRAGSCHGSAGRAMDIKQGSEVYLQVVDARLCSGLGTSFSTVTW